MQYTTMEKLNARVSRLGFGCMRFPTTPEGKIDEPRAAAMIDTAYKAGVNYYDTAYFYHDRTSEEFVGRTMKAYPRESFYFATKLPMGIIESREQALEIYESQFVKLQTDYIDFYLLHALNANNFKKAKDFGLIDFLVEQKKLGRIKRLGFSFHDSYEVFEEIINYRDWDFCQIQFNYMDIDIQAGMKGYELCVRKDIPIVVMEPVKGGSLATLSEDIAGMFKAARPDQSVASWAMRWVGSLENCRVILSGMSNEEQVADNLKTFETFEPLSEAEQKVVSDVRDAIRSRVFVGCTGCKYCMPCPFGVDIPRNFSAMNNYAMYNNKGSLDWAWKNMGEAAANACRQCGKCESACPQQLPIRAKLAEITAKMNG
ncbi:MAG: aldo/keto reductase [Clostridia bacterium]|nr:aldo/keto reductase [Clostridia bacterium]